MGLCIVHLASFLILASTAVGVAGETLEGQLQRAEQLRQSGAYREALREYYQVLAQLERGNPTRLLIAVLNNLAGLEADLENYPNSERLYLRALRACDEVKAPDSRLSIQQNLLALFLQARWLGKADQLVSEAPGDFSTATPSQRLRFLDGIGSLRRGQKRLDEAVACYREAVNLAQATGDSNAAGFLWNSLGVVRVEQHDVTQALSAFEQALSVHENAGQHDHPVLITTLTNLGWAYLTESRYHQAEAALERARHIAERFLGPSNPALYRILMLEARLLDQTHRKAEAKRVRRKAEDIRPSSSIQESFAIDLETLRRK